MRYFALVSIFCLAHRKEKYSVENIYYKMKYNNKIEKNLSHFESDFLDTHNYRKTNKE